MAAFRGTPWAFYFHEPTVRIRVETRVPHELFLEPAIQTVAGSALTGETTPLTRDEADVIKRLAPDRWTAAKALGDAAETARALAERGICVADDDHGPLAALRKRDEQLTAEQWSRYAAFFHFLDRRRDGITVRSAEAELWAPRVPDALQEYVDQHGQPPPEFHRREPLASLELPDDDRGGGLYDALRARRTTRAFDPAAISLTDFSIMLRYAFGCHGYWPFVPGLASLRKTAPSGGGLHPIEAYPIVLNVCGAVSGVHHYSVEHHSLDLLAERDANDLRPTVTRILCGQEYLVANVAALVVLSVRFFRNYWKYRRDARAYAALLLDAGHLSQSFQLVAADLGLGSFFTAAYDGPLLEALIDVDGVSESVLGVVGCGRPAVERSVLDPDPDPFTPRRR